MKPRIVLFLHVATSYSLPIYVFFIIWMTPKGFIQDLGIIVCNNVKRDVAKLIIQHTAFRRVQTFSLNP